MDTRTRTILLWSGVAILIVSGIVMLFLSFGGSKEATTDDLNAIYTNAASTVAAQQQTLQAGLFSATPNPALSSPTATLTFLPTLTLQAQTPILLPTSSTGVSVVTACDGAVYMSDVTIPDGTEVTPGQAFTKTWKVSNTGTCTWTATYKIVFVAGDSSMSGQATAIGKVVKPGESVDISVALIAPAAAAQNLSGTWRLSNDKAVAFGDSLTVVIKSGGTAGTGSTATSTITIATVSVATTEIPVNTPMPTDTPIPTP